MDLFDDCFLWTDASSSSGSSTMSEAAVKCESYDDADSDKLYKKKLQKKLFKDDNEVKRELLMEVDDKYKGEPETPAVQNDLLDNVVSVSSLQTKKESKIKKRKNKENTDTHHDATERNIEIVTESNDFTSNSQSRNIEIVTESNDFTSNSQSRNIEIVTESNDFTSNSQSRKRKLSLHSNTTGNNLEDDVKHKKSKKGKKRKKNEHIQNIENDADQNIDVDSDKAYKKKLHKKLFEEKTDFDVKQDLLKEVDVKGTSEPPDDSNELVFSDDVSHNNDSFKNIKEKLKKKKKSKKNTESHVDCTDGTDNDSDIEKVIESNDSTTNSQSRKRKLSLQSNTENLEENDECRNTKKDNKGRKVKNPNNMVSSTDHVTSENAIDHNARKHNSIIKHSHHTSIADRIQYEDDVEGIGLEEDDTHSAPLSYPLKQYIHVHPYLQIITSKSENESVISKDDEVWLFKCPHDIDIMCLKDTEVTIDSKCKLKHNNQTYIGKLEHPTKVGIVDFESRGPKLKSFKTKGCITLHKKIPKAHIAYDKLMMDNQHEYIPLPDTKCRHPLFGVDYERFISIPSTVKTCLRGTNSGGKLVEKVKKKKSKLDAECKEIDTPKRSRKRKVNTEEQGEESGQSVSAAAEHQTYDTVPRKRRRHQPDAAKNSWDSEKAIEQNLFNF